MYPCVFEHVGASLQATLSVLRAILNHFITSLCNNVLCNYQGASRLGNLTVIWCLNVISDLGVKPRGGHLHRNYFLKGCAHSRRRRGGGGGGAVVLPFGSKRQKFGQIVSLFGHTSGEKPSQFQ